MPPASRARAATAATSRSGERGGAIITTGVSAIWQTGAKSAGR
jgi:hypothetical protein